MKITISLLLVACALTTSAQRKTYQLKLGHVLDCWDIQAAAPVANCKQLIKDSYLFTIETKNGKDYVVWLLEFEDKAEYDGFSGKDLNARLFKDATTGPIYFRIPEAVWDAYVTEVFSTRGSTFGLINVPMKVRFRNTDPDHRKRYTDLDGNANLGLSFAPYWKRGDDQIIFLSFGVTVTQIRIDQLNTLDFVAQPENRSGFSLFTGLIYQKENYQIGLLAGNDFVTGEASEYWVYQGKVWLGVGIGIGIFQPNNKPPKNQGN
jgi:hypothetical protein